MKCLCGNNFISKNGEVEFNSRLLGKIKVPDLRFFECDNCNEILLNCEEADKATGFIEDKEERVV